MTLARLRARQFAERFETFRSPAVGDHTVDRGQSSPNAGHLRHGLVPASEYAERCRTAVGQMFRRDATRCPRAETAELVGFDHCDERGRLGVKETDDKRRTLSGRGVELAAGNAELEIRGSHVGERALAKTKSASRRDLHVTGSHAAKARFDDLDRVVRTEKRRDVVLGQIERHGCEVYERLGARRRLVLL